MSWQVSAYPVILSLENHCSQEQQEVMAQYLISILGDKLLRAPLDQSTSGDLPSPNVRLREVRALDIWLANEMQTESFFFSELLVQAERW